MLAEHELLPLAERADAAALSLLADALTVATRQTAFACFPVTGSAPFKSKAKLKLELKRRDLTRLLHMSRALHSKGLACTRSPEWRRLYAHCMHQYQLCWTCDPFYQPDVEAWMEETQGMISATRSDVRAEQRKMQKRSYPRFRANPASTVHRMLQSDALPAHLLSVVDSAGELTSTPKELEDVMVQHFEQVFTLPGADAFPLPREPPAMLFDKPSVQPEWYGGLMAPVSEEELLGTLSDIPLLSAAGEDGVSAGLWKIALQGSTSLRRLTRALFDACLRSSIFPSAWKTSVIVPLVKDAQKERAMSNIRPISLQSCLGKLLNKLLAQRLGSILARHPILHPAQRGFVQGGTTKKCIDELLDAWEWSRERRREFYTIFYDIKQAYDSVETPVLVRAMRRLRLPQGFISLVEDSLTGLSSCVRTAYGHSRFFAVLRSLRQGDPLAPLLFVLLMDALHEGLELNPFTGLRHGCVLEAHAPSDAAVELASLGYADDTSALATSLVDLKAQNEWVQFFMAFNHLRLNPLKCEVVGRKADGTPLAQADLALHGVSLDGHLPQPGSRPSHSLPGASCQL